MEDTIKLLNKIDRFVQMAELANTPLTIPHENMRDVLDHIAKLTEIINTIDAEDRQSDTIYRSKSEKVMSFEYHAFKNILISLDRRCWSCDYAFQMQDWINHAVVYSGDMRILCDDCCTHLMV